MFYSAKNGTIAIDNTDIDYIVFGNGKKNLLMIPGLSDGLKTAKGMAVPFALMYKKLAKDYRVYVMSRRNVMPQGFTTRDMAKDVAFALQKLGVNKLSVVGVSQGGMIAQYLALDFPDMIEKLVLTVTLARQNDTVQKVISTWMDMAKCGDYKSLMIDTAEKYYSEKYLKKNRWVYPLMGNVGKPKSFERFLIMAQACIEHDAFDELVQITCPTLVIGGKKDQIVTGEASIEISTQISGSEIHMYEEFGHAANEEAKDFLDRIMEFCQ